MVGDRDRERGRDNEEERDKRPLGYRFQVVETLIGRLGPGSQDPGSEERAK